MILLQCQFWMGTLCIFSQMMKMILQCQPRPFSLIQIQKIKERSRRVRFEMLLSIWGLKRVYHLSQVYSYSTFFCSSFLIFFNFWSYTFHLYFGPCLQTENCTVHTSTMNFSASWSSLPLLVENFKTFCLVISTVATSNHHRLVQQSRWVM